MSERTDSEVIDMLTAAEQIADGLADLARAIYDRDNRWKDALAAANKVSVHMQEARRAAEEIEEAWVDVGRRDAHERPTDSFSSYAAADQRR